MNALPVPRCIVGESPLWHPAEQALYWCDIVGRRLHRFDPATQTHRQWDFDSDVACCAPTTRLCRAGTGHGRLRRTS